MSRPTGRQCFTGYEGGWLDDGVHEDGDGGPRKADTCAGEVARRPLRHRPGWQGPPARRGGAGAAASLLRGGGTAVGLLVVGSSSVRAGEPG